MSRPLDAQDVAKYLVAHTDWEAGETISNLKLLKLVYYAQGFCVAMRGEPLFSETVQAWANGPVVREVYDAYKHNAYLAIPAPVGFDPDAYLPEDRELLDAVLSTYGQLSATRLRDLTHEERPWQEANGTLRQNEPISVSSMHEFFKPLVEAGRRGESAAGRPAWPTLSLVFQQRRRSSERMEPHRTRLRKIASGRSPADDPWEDDD